MKVITFEAFKVDALARGFNEVVERSRAAGIVFETHTHPFSVFARLVRGEMWLTVGTEVVHLLPGDPFTVEANVPHAERYGVDGATYWVARRNGRLDP